MLQGTGSDVGKSVLVAGLCRLAKRQGRRVFPFKPQNMSNNAAVAAIPGTNQQGEIGRAQWLQALACDVAPTVHMNPVLLKPQSASGSQIVVQGKVWGSAKGRDYQKLKPQLLQSVMESYENLKQDADLIIVEGAGSPAEINLRAGDIANMGFATAADVPVVLVGDIDRGGVIASLVGTHTILDATDRAQVAGYIINKFRGDVSLFDDGIDQIGNFTDWPCFGVIPWLDAVGRLPPEDSVALDRNRSSGGKGKKIVVPVLPRIANFDDFDPFLAEPDVDLIFLKKGEQFPEDAAMVILPGSKATLADLDALFDNGWAEPIQRATQNSTPVIGICGGYQMMGQSVHDPQGLEGETRDRQGLGLLDITTVLEPEKTVRTSNAVDCAYDQPVDGYEIHMGRTEGPDTKRAMIRIDGRDDGAVAADGRARGCYLHGLFANDEYRRALLRSIGVMSASHSFRDGVIEALDDLADSLEELLDPRLLRDIPR